MRMDRQLQRRVDASDIVQDVLIEANRRLEGYLKDPAIPFHLYFTPRKMSEENILKHISLLNSIIESPADLQIFSLDTKFRYTVYNSNPFPQDGLK